MLVSGDVGSTALGFGESTGRTYGGQTLVDVRIFANRHGLDEHLSVLVVIGEETLEMVHTHVTNFPMSGK
jgi:hypothetical protein